MRQDPGPVGAGRGDVVREGDKKWEECFKFNTSYRGADTHVIAVERKNTRHAKQGQ